ncbi:MAG: dihydrolipoamide acetyltransferase family protein [Nitrospirota bacterium]|nr:dihydrolipoamide acetyltransferase family protein [Nitrospirota bacterium]
MATDIVMPQLGESTAEGTVLKWLIPTGEHVEKDQVLLEVETDKVALEIPAPASGELLEILVQEGETVEVGTVIARLGNHQGNGSPTPKNNGSSSSQPMPTIEVPVEEGDHYSPAVKQVAQEHGVDLTQVTGTGAGGRVTRKDVLNFLQSKGKNESPTTPLKQPTSTSPTMGSSETLLPMTTMRRTIAERMVVSRQTSAHVATFFEADFSAVDRGRKEAGLTALPFVIHAVTRAMKDFPILNSSWSDEGVIVKHEVNMGVAVALEDGLLVPVIKQAEQKGVRQLGKEVADLASRARSKQLAPDEVQGGTFTITNHGGMGSLFSTPIINQPQIAILGVGATQKRAVVINDAIVIRPMAYLSLSFDHRVIDGATADRFMARVRTILEESEWRLFL